MNTYRDLAFMRRALIRSAGHSFILIVGGTAVLRLTPGPLAAAIAATVAYFAAASIAMYLVEKRWPLHGR